MSQKQSPEQDKALCVNDTSKRFSNYSISIIGPIRTDSDPKDLESLPTPPDPVQARKSRVIELFEVAKHQSFRLSRLSIKLQPDDMPRLDLSRAKSRLMRKKSDGSLSSHGSWIHPLPKIDVRAVLQNSTKHPVSLYDFREYLLKVEFGSEALDFWLTIEDLKRQLDVTMRHVVINQTVDVFVKAG